MRTVSSIPQGFILVACYQEIPAWIFYASTYYYTKISPSTDGYVQHRRRLHKSIRVLTRIQSDDIWFERLLLKSLVVSSFVR